jgi:hypothetical protein
MKATVDIPDELYRKVKAKSALLGKPVREVTVELYERWLAEAQGESAAGPAGRNWLDQFLAHRIPAATPGATAREILEEGRNRLEPPPRRRGRRK